MNTKKQLRKEITKLTEEIDVWENCHSKWAVDLTKLKDESNKWERMYYREYAKVRSVETKVAELVTLTHPQQTVAIISQ